MNANYRSEAAYDAVNLEHRLAEIDEERQSHAGCAEVVQALGMMDFQQSG